MNTKWKIITLIMLVVLGFCTCFTAVFISRANKDLERSIALYTDSVQAIVSSIQEQTSRRYQSRIKSFLNNSATLDIKKAFAERDREGLIRLTTPYFELFKKENPHFATLTWISPDNIACLHMHDTNKPRTDVSKIRPDVVSANRDHLQHAGFAISAVGMQYRIVNPVTYGGQYIGVLHFGLKMDMFTEPIQNKLHLPVGLVISKEKYKKIKNKKFGFAGSSFAVMSPQIELFKEGFDTIDWTIEKQRVVLHGKDYAIVKAASLDNYAQESQGHIFVALDISRQVADAHSDILSIIVLSAALLGFSFIVLYSGYETFSKKLEGFKIVERVNSELEKQVAERTRELRQSENKFRELVEDLSDWVWEVDENWVYTYASPVATKILGFTPDEIIGKTPFDFMDAVEARRVRERLEQYVEKKSALKGIVNTCIHKNGQKVVVETSGQVVIDEDGTYKGYRGVDRDITQRQQAVEALHDEKELLSVTLRSIGDAVITTDIAGKVVFLNKVAEELTGWIYEEAKGKLSTEVFSIVNEKTGQKCASPVQRVLELGRIIGLANHTALIAKDGTIRSIADSGAPIRDRDSKIIGVVLVFRDISHEKKVEEELLKIRKLESVGVLAGGIAHDFNNILSAILGNIELVSRRIAKEDGKTTSLLSAAKKATRRATKLTGQLLTFSKGGNPVKEETSLPKLITESANFVLHGSNVVCSYDFPEDLWAVDVDSGQIGQVIQNIIINAKHAMPEGGKVAVKCANVADAAAEALLSVNEGDYVRITIQDTGVGIPQEVVDKIFDPYFTTKQEGSGLGLAICHSIISKHDGHIMVQSKPGKGTTFTLYLPAEPLAAITAAKQQKSNSAVKAARVMVMDDEEMLRNLAQGQLSALGHEAIPVADGEQAINKYQELQDSGTPVDLVIMDLTIPGGMGGQEAAQKLLQLDPEAKIIVASGYSSDPVIANYREYGFCAAVVKPFDLAELKEGIDSALG